MPPEQWTTGVSECFDGKNLKGSAVQAISSSIFHSHVALLSIFATHHHCYLEAHADEFRWFSELTFLNKEICDVGVVADLIKAFGLY